MSKLAEFYLVDLMDAPPPFGRWSASQPQLPQGGAQMSKIAWTEKTWNPVTGCTEISDGCKNCYAKKMAKRLQAMDIPKYRNGFDVTIHKDALNQPALWGKPALIFVCSMSDLFHDDVPPSFIFDVFRTMEACHQHTFQVLTKRSKRLVEFASRHGIPPKMSGWASRLKTKLTQRCASRAFYKSRQRCAFCHANRC